MRERHLPVWGFGVLVVANGAVLWLPDVVLAGLYEDATAVGQLWLGTVPTVASLLLVLAVVARLRWWRPVWWDDRPVQAWVRIVPVVLIVAALSGASYAALAGAGAGVSAMLLLTALLTGLSEELMFRGVGVTVFRSNGFSEGSVALWSSLTFGLGHAISLQSTAMVDVVVTAGHMVVAGVMGYFLYLTRRRSGSLLLAVVVHGLHNVSVMSGWLVEGPHNPVGTFRGLAVIALVVVVWVGRKEIEPRRASGVPSDPVEQRV